jgi:hypothetical protein
VARKRGEARESTRACLCTRGRPQPAWRWPMVARPCTPVACYGGGPLQVAQWPGGEVHQCEERAVTRWCARRGERWLGAAGTWRSWSSVATSMAALLWRACSCAAG